MSNKSRTFALLCCLTEYSKTAILSTTTGTHGNNGQTTFWLIVGVFHPENGTHLAEHILQRHIQATHSTVIKGQISSRMAWAKLQPSLWFVSDRRQNWQQTPSVCSHSNKLPLLFLTFTHFKQFALKLLSISNMGVNFDLSLGVSSCICVLKASRHWCQKNSF